MMSNRKDRKERGKEGYIVGGRGRKRLKQMMERWRKIEEKKNR